MDVLTAMAGVSVLVAVTAVVSLLVGRVPDRKPPTAPRSNGDFEVWPFF